MLTGFELYTDIDLDTAVAIPLDFACDVRENVSSKKVHFGRSVWYCLGFGSSSLSWGRFSR